MDQHVHSLIPDYVLGLLTETDRRRLEAHVSQCALCRLALAREQQIEQLVQHTLQVATQPNPGQLQVHRPRPTTHGPMRQPPIVRQLAPVLLLVVMLLGSLALQSMRTAGDLDLKSPGFYWPGTSTATSTSTPTATLAALPAGSTPDPTSGAMAMPPTAALAYGSAPVGAEAPLAASATVYPVATPNAASTTSLTR